MADSEICKDLSMRLCGAAIGVHNGGDLLAALQAEDCGGLTFKELSEDCGAVIFCGDDFNAEEMAGGRPYIILCENCEEQEKRYGCACLPLDGYDEAKISRILRALAGEFALLKVCVNIPEWMRFLPQDNSAIAELLARVREVCKGVSKVKHAPLLSAIPEGTSHWSAEANIYVNFASGEAKVTCAANEGIFFEMLSEIAGDKIDGEYSLMKYVRSASEAQKGYAKVRDALGCAQVNGYGIVSPSADDLSYENPQLVRQGSSVGIKLKASAPTYHIIRVDVAGEVSPIMGESSQSESIVNGMMKEFETNPENAWNTDVFGKSLRTMVQEGLVSKVSAIGDDTRAKLRKAITRMTNEGKGGVICVIL